VSEKQLQRDLFHYLSIELDPYDFSYYLEDWVRETDTGLSEMDVSALSQSQLKEFVSWLKANNKPEEYARDLPIESPAYLHMQAQEMLPVGTWLIHFSRKQFNKFQFGTTLDGLHLSTWKREKQPADCGKNLKSSLFEAVFGFAFPAEARNVLRYGESYGRNLVLFRTDAAVLAYHYGDAQHQAVFPLCSEYDVHALTMNGGILGDLTGQTNDGEEIEFGSVEECIDYLDRKHTRGKQLRGL
jgi:hypothetical protein